MKKQRNLYFIFIGIIAFVMFALPGISHAVAKCPDHTIPKAGICVPKSDDTRFHLSDADVSDTIYNVAEALLGFLAALAVLIIVIAGVMYITSAGDQDRIDNAKKWLLYAIIGLVVALLAYLIVYSVGQMLGVTS